MNDMQTIAVTGGHPECPPVAADLLYQRLSAIAYQPEAIMKLELARLDYRLIEHIHDAETGADAIVVVNEAEVVIAFRGTQKNYADIMADLKFRLCDFMLSADGVECHVHRGFAEQWYSIRHQIFTTAQAAAAGRRRIVATGHSLGGALAVLCSIRYRMVDVCITFGSPRVGDIGVSAAMAASPATHRRYVFGADVVPIVPLMAMDYRHDCRPIYLTRSGKPIRGCSLWREILGRARSVLTLDWAKGWTMCPIPARMFTDHRIGEYGNAMARTSRA